MAKTTRSHDGQSPHGGARQTDRDDKTNLRSRYTLRGVQIASLGNASHEAIVGHRDGLSSGSVRWTASAGCLNSTLRRVIGAVAAAFGPVTVNSTCRSVRHNAAVGGAHRSHHIGGNAVDFSVKATCGHSMRISAIRGRSAD